MLVTIDFFKQLFNKTFDIGSDTNKIANKQQIDESFVETLLGMNENQFLTLIKNSGYDVDNSPKENIIFFICYKTAEQLILGQNAMLPDSSTLKEIARKSAEYEAIIMNNVNKVVQNVPIVGCSIPLPKENLQP